MPHTPKGEVVRGLEAHTSTATVEELDTPRFGSQGSQDSSIDGGDGGGEESEVESSSEEDLGPPPAPTGFKLNLGKVAANQVDDAKPVAMPHTPKGEVVHGLLAAGGPDLGGGGRGKPSRASCSAVDAGALAQQGVHEGMVERIEQGLARRGSSLFCIGGGTSGTDGGGGGGEVGGVLTRRTSVVPVDTTGDGRADALAVDTNKDGRIDALIKLGDLGEAETGAVGAALPGLDPSAEARASVLAKALAAMRPLDSFPVALALDGLNAAQSMSSSIISLASRCFNLGVSLDRGISKVTTC